MTLLQVLNLLLIIAIAVVGIVGFVAPTRALATDQPVSDASTQGTGRKRLRVIIPVAAVALIVILAAAELLSPLSGAAGGNPPPESSEDGLFGDSTISSVVFISAAVMLGGIVFLGLVLVLVICALIIYKASTRARKMLAFGVAFLTILIVLSSLSFFLDWGWNFPDIFGTVGGIISLALLVNDRFLAK